MPESFAGIDVGGTNVKMVLVDREGRLLATERFPTTDDAAASWIVPIRERLAQWQADGAGVASPGLVPPEGRRVAWMEGRMQALKGLDWTERLDLGFSVPVLNDGHAALLGEAWLGAARGTRNAILLTLGTGVGGAAMVDGNVLRGHLGRAGHLGHLCLDPEGVPDIVGTPGSLEDAVGDATVARRTGGRWPTTEALLASTDGAARTVWLLSVRALACGVASLVNVLDPEVVVLAGGIASAGEALTDPLALELDRVEWRPDGQRVRIVLAELGDLSGAIGAARHAMERVP